MADTTPQRPVATFLRGRFTQLLLALVILHLTMAMTSLWGPHADWISRIAFILVLVAALRALLPDRRPMAHFFLLAAIALSLDLLTLFLVQRGILVGRQVAHLLILLLVAGSTMKYVLSSGRVTTDRIVAAICVYMFIGMIWASAYVALAEVIPQSYAFSAQMPTDRRSVSLLLNYFSYTTLTTLGYGDITPIHPATRALAYIEACVGQLFVATLIARLVSLEVAHREKH